MPPPWRRKISETIALQDIQEISPLYQDTDVVPIAPSHVTGEKAERAYRLNDALKKRRTLTEGWCAYREPKNCYPVDLGVWRTPAHSTTAKQ